MDGRTQAPSGSQTAPSDNRRPGTDDVSRLWVGLEHQQEVLGPIAVELMALLCPDASDVAPPESGTGVTSPE